MYNELDTKLITMIANASDTGWKKRADGTYTRLLRFDTPITRETRGPLVLAYIHGDPPPGIKVTPGSHIDKVSPEGLLLRIKVLPFRGSLPHSAVHCNNSLFKVLPSQVLA